MELRTDRLLLRPWGDADIDRLFTIRSNVEVAKWLGDPEPWESVDRARLEVDKWNARGLPLGVWAVVPAGQSVAAGSVSLSNLPGSNEFETGWYLHPDSVGRGYASEAARAVVEHAFASGIRRVWAIMWAHNEPSAAVARSIGMDHLGVRHDPWYGTEEDPDSRMFRIDAPMNR